MGNLKHGDILICRGRSIISKTIMKATQSKWSHAALYLVVDGVPSIIEAQKNGVNLKTFENWRKVWNYDYIIFRTVGKLNNEPITTRALSKSGETAYDFQSFIIRQPIKLITGKWRNKGDKEDDKMICSEFVAWVYALPNWWKMTPQDLYIYLNEHDTKFKQVI